MEYLPFILKTQSCYGAVRFILSFIAFPTLIGFLDRFVQQDRLAFNCHPKPNDVAKQGCYFRYNDDTSALLSPLFFAGITCGILAVFWTAIILYSVKCLRDITEEVNYIGRERRRHKFWQWFVFHVLIEAVLLMVMLGLFCHSQTIILPKVYNCHQKNSSMQIPLAQKENLTCSDLFYKQKSFLNIAIIAVMSVILFLCIVALIHAVWKKNDFINELVVRDANEAGNKSWKLQFLAILLINDTNFVPVDSF